MNRLEPDFLALSDQCHTAVDLISAAYEIAGQVAIDPVSGDLSRRDRDAILAAEDELLARALVLCEQNADDRQLIDQGLNDCLQVLNSCGRAVTNLALNG